MTKWTEENKLKVRALQSEGLSLRQISERTGLSKSSIHSFTKTEPPSLHIQEVEIPTIQTEMINDHEANQFVNEIIHPKPAPNPEARFPKNKAKAEKADAFIDSLLKPTKPKAERKVKKTEEPEDPVRKGEVLAKITLNINNFEPLLRDFIKPNREVFLTNLQKKSAVELETLLQTMETTRKVSNLTNQFTHFFYMGSNLLEVGTTQYLGFDTTGFSMALRQQQEEIQMIMREICMDKINTFEKATKPEVRLAMIMTTTLIGVNTSNQMKKLQQRTRPPAPQAPQAPKQETPKPEAELNGQKPSPPKVKMLIPEETVQTFEDL
jgi:hypothetical protein